MTDTLPLSDAEDRVCDDCGYRTRASESLDEHDCADRTRRADA